MLFGDVICDFCKNRTLCINTMCEQNSAFFNVNISALGLSIFNLNLVQRGLNRLYRVRIFNENESSIFKLVYNSDAVFQSLLGNTVSVLCVSC